MSIPDDTYNKNRTRYICKNDPELWEWVVMQTSFLPSDAKPKQRIWHILNDVYEIPICPVSGKTVKWWENRYLTYYDRSSAHKSPELTAQRMKTYKEKTGFDSWNGKDNIVGYQKLKNTSYDRWGSWATGNRLLNSQILDTKIRKGICRTEEEKSEIEKYYNLVKNYTDNSWYYFFSKINPDRLERGKEFHLDHIYSKKVGFDNNIPPEIIGHWTNLRLITSIENVEKWYRCDKTINQLYEDYYNNGGLLSIHIFKYCCNNF